MNPKSLLHRFLGNLWHAIHTALWNPMNTHRLLGDIAFGGSVVAAYAAYRFLSAKTREDRAQYGWMGYIVIAVDAMKLGADDFVIKPVDLHDLGQVVDRAPVNLNRKRLG